MRIPVPDGEQYPMVSASMLRTYGAGGFTLDEQEQERGCPRRWKAKYVDHSIPDTSSYALDYGSLIHRVLYRMEEDAIGPEDALAEEFDASMAPEAWLEAADDLRKYMERGTPHDRFGTIAVEEPLQALLYEDEEYGPIWFRGVVDWLGIDLDDPHVLHGVDFKTNRTPPSVADVYGDAQLKGYDWLIRENWRKWMKVGRPRTVMHLDAIKWRDVEVRFSQDDIDGWHDWAVAVVRAILRDEDAEPSLNPGCAWCPIRDDCPAWLGMPDAASALLQVKPDDRDDLIAWRERANGLRLLLEKAVAEVDGRFKTDALAEGEIVAGGFRWTVATKWQPQVDTRRLHELLPDRFYDVVTTTKKALTAATRDMDPSEAEAVMKCIGSVPAGRTVQRRKA